MKNHEILEKNVGLLAIFMVIAVSIGEITWTHEVSGTSGSDDWRSPVAG